jgi:hypothetical protein
VIAVKSVDADGKPTAFKAVDLPVHEQSDWNAAEGKAGHVLNRTHYVDEKGVIHKLPNKFIDADWMATKEDGGSGKTVIIPEQTVSSGMWRNLQGALVTGVVYAVEVNGILYRCVCRSYDGTLYLGNGALIDEGVSVQSDEPFCLAWMGGAATGGMFYNDGTLNAPIGLKVNNWEDDIYNTLPKEFLPGIEWDDVSNKPFVEDTGELLFSHTATFATDDAAVSGVRTAANNLKLVEGAEYWLEINGDMIKCHCEDATAMGWNIYDSANNKWMQRSVGYIYIYGQTAGTYTYNLYDSAEKIVLDPRYIPNSIARKSDIPEAGGGADIDVTATVGQTIIVKEVGENGKPTKWESADYQPRTHYTAEAEILPETTFTLDNAMCILGAFLFTVGDTYKVTWDRVEYECVAVDFSAMQAGVVALGNLGDYGLEDTGEPFVIMSGDAFGGSMGMSMDADATSATVKITGNVDVQIPEKYIPSSVYPFFVNILEDGNTYVTLNTQAELKAAIDTKQHIMAKLTQANGDICIGHLLYSAADAAGVRFITGTPSVKMIDLSATADGHYTIALVNN